MRVPGVQAQNVAGRRILGVYSRKETAEKDESASVLPVSSDWAQSGTHSIRIVRSKRKECAEREVVVVRIGW